MNDNIEFWWGYREAKRWIEIEIWSNLIYNSTILVVSWAAGFSALGALVT